MVILMELISKEKLLEFIKNDEVTVINVLASFAYTEEHIKGSISMPFNIIEDGGWNKLDQKKPVVPYCAGKTCHASRRAGEILESHGMKVYVYEGGISEWRDSGLPMEGEKYNRK